MQLGVFALVILLGLSLSGGAEAAPGLNFSDYGASSFQGVEAPLRLDSDRARQFRTRLKQAFKEPINLGGQYVFTTWGTDPDCTQGAAIDVETGRVFFMPEPVCTTGADPAYDFRADSTLMVTAGRQENQESDQREYFQITADGFKPLKQKSFLKELFGEEITAVQEDPVPEAFASGVPVPQSRPISADIEPAAGDFSQPSWDKLWEVADGKPYDFVLMCYLQVSESMSSEITATLAGPDFESNFLRFGGNNKIADLSVSACNEKIRLQNRFQDETAYEDAQKTIKYTAAHLDESFLKSCKTDLCKAFAEKALQ